MAFNTILKDRHLARQTLVTSCVLILLSACDQISAKRACLEYFHTDDVSGYQLLEGGMALHIGSGTIWYRCPAGQRFRHGECEGEALLMTWEEATSYATEMSELSSYDWQLPSNEQFKAITTSQCLNPAVNTNVFPKLPIENFWTRGQNNVMYGRRYCVAYSYQGRIACREPEDAVHRFLLVTAPE